MALKRKFKELYSAKGAQNSFLEDIYGNQWSYGTYTVAISPDKNLMTICVTLKLNNQNEKNDGTDNDRADDGTEENEDQG
jgi:hypothetical protein